MTVNIKRVYEKPTRSDGKRILVDRLWPRGIKKEEAKIDLWIKEIGPSNELRKWFGHDEKKWQRFRKEYKKEIAKNKDILYNIINKYSKITLIYSAKDQEHNNAQVLKEYITRLK